MWPHLTSASGPPTPVFSENIVVPLHTYICKMHLKPKLGPDDHSPEQNGIGRELGAGGGKGIKKSYQYLENIHQATDILTSSDRTAGSGTQTSLSTGWVKLSTKGSPHEPYDTKQKVLLQGQLQQQEDGVGSTEGAP